MSDWSTTSFDPIAGLIGGVLIGGAVVLLLYLIGRIAGISGITIGVFTKRELEQRWRLAFIVGLLSAPLLYVFFGGSFEVDTQVSPLLMGIGGLLVGFGTRLGSGCTSGHGVAGIARFSPRSIVATVTFLSTAIITTNIIRYL